MLDISIWMNTKIFSPTINPTKSLLKHIVVRYRTYFPKSSYFICVDYIRDIDEVRPGFDTLTFDALLRHQIVHADKVDFLHWPPSRNDWLFQEEFAFSIIYNNYRDELHLMADDIQIRNIWVSALQYLIDQYPEKQRRNIIRDNKWETFLRSSWCFIQLSFPVCHSWILSCLRFGDKDQSNTMTKEECQQLLQNSLNVQLTEETFDGLFQVQSISWFTSDSFHWCVGCSDRWWKCLDTRWFYSILRHSDTSRRSSRNYAEVHQLRLM